MFCWIYSLKYGGFVKFGIFYLIYRDVSNYKGCCFKLLSLGVICFVVIINIGEEKEYLRWVKVGVVYIL